MQNRILVLSSGGKETDSIEKLCLKLIYGAADAGVAVVHFNLNRLDLGYCTGCGQCKKTGLCVMEDDMPKLLAYMQEARATVFASPVRCGNVNGLMKTLWDRSRILQQPHFTRAAFLASAEKSCGEMAQQALQSYLNYINCLQVENVGTVLAESYSGASAYRDLQQAYHLGSRL